MKKFKVFDKEYNDYIKDGCAAITNDDRLLLWYSGGLAGSAWLEQDINKFIITYGEEDKNGNI